MNLDIIVVATGNLAEALVNAVETIVGPKPNLRAVSCRDDGDTIGTGNLMAEMIKKSSADFTVILSDAYVSAPTGAALLSISKCKNAAVITGVNLVSIIHALEMGEKSTDVHKLLASIERESRKGIRVITGEDVLDTRG